MARFFFLTTAVLVATSIVAPVNAHHPRPEESKGGGFAPDSVLRSSLRRCPSVKLSTVAPEDCPIPSAIEVPPTEGQLYFRLYANGTQNYRCDAGSGWTFMEPLAVLHSVDHSRHVGSHYRLPTPDANGGSALFRGRDMERCGGVVGYKVAEVPSPDGSLNIPWLKLAATSTKGADDCIYSKAKFILRVRTNGGRAPDTAMCGEEYKNGTVIESPYTAQYWFYGAPSKRK